MLAIVLGAWSYYHWIATVRKEPRSQVFRHRPWIASTTTGFGLFALGQAMIADRWYEHTGWAIVFVFVIVDGARRWRSLD